MSQTYFLWYFSTVPENKQTKSCPFPAPFEGREHTLQFSVTVAIFKVVWKFLKLNEPNEVIKAGYTDTHQSQILWKEMIWINIQRNKFTFSSLSLL